MEALIVPLLLCIAGITVFVSEIVVAESMPARKLTVPAPGSLHLPLIPPRLLPQLPQLLRGIAKDVIPLDYKFTHVNHPIIVKTAVAPINA